jgi:molybdate transport system substrate-binding protein
MRRLVLFLFLAAAAFPARAAEREVTVFAAASLTDALQEIGRDYEAANGVRVRFSFAASSLLARQIEAGAEADLFFSADAEWMDYLDGRKLIRPHTRRDVLSNRLVLIAPVDSAVTLNIAPGFALAAALGDGRLALADPQTVPAGRYAKAALTALGVWALEGKLAPAENVRAALAYVARGEAPLGIVYRTDALAEPKVKTLDVFPASTHPPIVYPAALTATADEKEASALLLYIMSAKAAAVFERHGFSAAPR